MSEKKLCDICGREKDWLVQLGDRHLCSECSIREAEKVMARQTLEQAIEEKKVPKSKILMQRIILIVQSIIILTGGVVVYMNYDSLRHALLYGPKPIRIGTLNTDKETDKCIANLWKISGLLQDGKTVTTAILCPSSNLPYVAQVNLPNITLSCPLPERHKLYSLSVSNQDPIPIVVEIKDSPKKE